MAGTVFTCKCGMLLKAYGDDQVGQGIVCPSCGSTVIVPAFGIAADASGASVSDDPASLPTTSRAGKWIGLACLGGLGVVTLGLSVFVLMPALSPRVAHPVVVAHTDSPRKNKLDDTTNDADPDEAPRRLRDGRERGTRKAVGKPQPKSAQRSRPGEPPPTSALRQRRPATNQASKRAQQLSTRPGSDDQPDGSSNVGQNGDLANSNATGNDASYQGTIGQEQFAENISVPFTGRQGSNRAKLLQREGGTAGSEKSVADGLDWIVRHQRSDGSWSLDYHEQCRAPTCRPERPSTKSDTAATGLALLSLLGAGHNHVVNDQYQLPVQRGLKWLTSHQSSDGDLFVGQRPSTACLYSHAIATMAICEAFGLSGDASLKSAAQRAVEFICHAQDPGGGGWRYAPRQPGDTSVFGWHIFALRSAHVAGIAIPQETLKACSRYLDLAATDETRVTYLYQPRPRRGNVPNRAGRQRGGNVVDQPGRLPRGANAVMTTEALLSRQLLGWPRDFPPLVKGVAMISADLQDSRERNIYYWYYATQLLHNMKGDEWERWNLKVREGLISTQVHDNTCADGSWDPFRPARDHWSGAAGRLYLTSLSILTLEVYYRYLPLYRSFDEE